MATSTPPKQDFSDKTWAAFRASGKSDINDFLKTDPRFAGKGFYADPNTYEISHPDDFYKDVDRNSISNPMERTRLSAQDRAAQALDGVDNLIGNKSTETPGYKGIIQPPPGKSAYQDASGNVSYDTNRSEGYTDQLGRTHITAIDARAPLSAAEISSRNNNEQFFASKHGVETQNDNIFHNRFSTPAAQQPSNPAPANQFLATRPPALSSPADIVARYGGKSSIPADSQAGYYDANGKFMGPAYTPQGTLIPMPKGATGLRGADGAAPPPIPTAATATATAPLPQHGGLVLDTALYNKDPDVKSAWDTVVKTDPTSPEWKDAWSGYASAHRAASGNDDSDVKTAPPLPPQHGGVVLDTHLYDTQPAVKSAWDNLTKTDPASPDWAAAQKGYGEAWRTASGMSNAPTYPAPPESVAAPAVGTDTAGVMPAALMQNPARDLRPKQTPSIEISPAGDQKPSVTITTQAKPSADIDG